MAHQHAHHSAPNTGTHRPLLLALLLTLGFAVVEAVAGLLSGSLALLGDAGHMLTDSLSLGLAATAALIARKPPSPRHSYGLGRAETLAALVNAGLMIVVVAAIGIEAVTRLQEPVPVRGGMVTVVAIAGLLINLGAAWLLAGHQQNLNVRAALLHVIGDLLGSVAALVSGVVIMVWGWTTIDPLLSLAIAVLILVSALRVLREALHALLEGVPRRWIRTRSAARLPGWTRWWRCTTCTSGRCRPNRWPCPRIWCSTISRTGNGSCPPAGRCWRRGSESTM